MIKSKMSDSEYLLYIKRKILKSCTVEYDKSFKNKEYLEKQFRNIYIFLIQTSEVLNQIANLIKNWSYNEASKAGFTRTPESAQFFLSPINIRSFTYDYLKTLQEKLIKAQSE